MVEDEQAKASPVLVSAPYWDRSPFVLAPLPSPIAYHEGELRTSKDVQEPRGSGGHVGAT
jgi:hypothetical protein